MAAVPAALGSGGMARMFPQSADGMVYLDTAATSLKPLSVVNAVDRYYRYNYSTIHRGMYPKALRTTDKYQSTRLKVHFFFKQKTAYEIIFTKGCTEGINLVALTFGDKFIGPGDEVIISESEHHSNIVPWQLLCKRRGCHLKVIPIDKDTGKLDTSSLSSLISNKTKLVAIQHKSNVTGITHPIKKVVAAARSVGAKVLLDAAQSCTDPSLNVKELDVDFASLSGHKMFGPTGVGILYGKRSLLQEMPPLHGGGDMVDRVAFNKTTFAPVPQRFEAGTPPIASVIGLGAAIDFITQVGRKKLQSHMNNMGDYARAQLKKVPGVKLLPSESSIVSFNTAHSPLDTATLLGASGFAVRAGHHCCQPLHRKFNVTSSLRLSTAPHTTTSEIDKFIASLKCVIGQLSGKKCEDNVEGKAK
eukprot:TRINITY_DN8845_c0_g1_i2.p1 TRINITY_DN8845_c0_g1~~TRINITY_DN8845_c0_g1_i2.p1  ORF type:complete len:434 (+),score=67.38 TRINITY_DN8845_c0_g1_i2:53-1303(+)